MKFRGFDETGLWYLKIIAMLALLVAILKMTGCAATSQSEDRSDCGVGYRKITIEEHDYLVFRLQGYDGASALHSESCPCRRKAERE